MTADVASIVPCTIDQGGFSTPQAYQHSLEAYEGAGASYYVEAVRGSLTRAEQLLAERRG